MFDVEEKKKNTRVVQVRSRKSIYSGRKEEAEGRKETMEK